MKILITGATGYLGGHLCEYFKQKGNEVTAFIRNPKKAGVLDEHDIPYVVGDMNDTQTIINALKTTYDVIVNCTGYINDRGPLAKFRKINVETADNLGYAMEQTGHRRLIHISSVAAYGDFGMDLTETTTPKKHKWFKYGLTKLESEEVLKKYELDITRLRPPYIVGVRDRIGFLPVLYHSMRKSGAWFNHGSAIIPVVHVKDVCSAVDLCIENSSTIGEVYNVASNEIVTIKEVAEIFHDILDFEIPTKSINYRYAYTIALLYEFLALFGIKQQFTRMGVMFGTKSATFPSDKLEKLGWETTRSAKEMITEWAEWRKDFEAKRKQVASS